MTFTFRARDYQSLVDLAVEVPDGGITVVCGLGDSGKSALIRCVRDTCFGSAGQGKVSVWAKEWVGTATVPGHQVVRRKGARVNSYRVDDEKPLVNVARGVPPQVGEALGLRAVDYGAGGSELLRRPQLGTQLEPHFLVVGETPSNAARILGSLSGAHVAFNAVREAQRQLAALATKEREEVTALEQATVSPERLRLTRPLLSLPHTPQVPVTRSPRPP